MRADTAGHVHAFVAGLVARNIEFSISARVSDVLDAAIMRVPARRWRPAINPDGSPRRDAQVAERRDVTLPGVAARTRMIVRREKPHQGAQLRLWDHGGWRHWPRRRSPTSAAEIGCGEGWAAISLAKAFPDIRVDEYDNDDASVAAARKNAAEAGVGDRERFEVLDVTGDLPTAITAGSYDLVMAFEMIHDLARPVEALTTMRRLGKPDAVR